jgi:hypothetical protein
MRQQLQTVSRTGDEIRLNLRWIDKGQLTLKQTPDSANSKGSKLSIITKAEYKHASTIVLFTVADKIL